MTTSHFRPISILVILSLLASLIPPWPVFAGTEVTDTSMDEALLLMFTANARLLKNQSQLPENSYTLAGHLSMPASQTTRGQVNEQRLLSQYFFDLAKQFPVDSSQNKTFLAKAYAHNEMAVILQRRRDRENNPLQNVGRAISRPFKFIAREITHLIRKGIKLLEEVGPEIICDMVTGYITTGTPINARIFFNKFKDIAMERVRKSLTNKATALIMGTPPRQKTVKPKATQTTSRLMQTMTVRAAKTSAKTATPEASPQLTVSPEKPKEYGKHTLTYKIGDLYNGMVISRGYFKPLISARTECGYLDFQGWDMEEFILTLQLDLDKGSLDGDLSGVATDYLEANDVTIPAWDFSARYSGSVIDGAVYPNSDKSGWILEGAIQITIAPNGQMRCIHYPLGYPEEPAEYVWLKTNRNLIVEQTISGTIDQQKGMKDGKPIITPGGTITLDIGSDEAQEDSGDYVFIQLENAKTSPAFPVP